MLDFMVIGLPRSGTTWAANWLTTAQSICLHDPLHTMHYTDWDSEAARWRQAVAGVSCTGIWRWTDWVNGHPARKVVIHRALAEVNESMRRIGKPPLARQEAELLNRIDGPDVMHVNFLDLFRPHQASNIWDHVFTQYEQSGSYPALEFDRERHNQLRQMEVQPAFDSVYVDWELQERLYLELQSMNPYQPNT